MSKDTDGCAKDERGKGFIGGPRLGQPGGAETLRGGSRPGLLGR